MSWGGHYGAGEVALWCAVLEQGIVDALVEACGAVRRGEYRCSAAAADWIGSHDFEAVCAMAGVDADTVAGRVGALMSGRAALPGADRRGWRGRVAAAASGRAA